MSVIIDSRLDVPRARQVAAFVDRLGLAGVWLRQPWWPVDGPVMSTADTAGLLAELAADGRVRAGLIADAGKADVSWPDRLATVAAAGQEGTAPAPGLRVAVAGAPGDVARWQHLIRQHAAGAVRQLATPARPARPAAGAGDTPPATVFVPCLPGRDLAAEISAAARGGPVLAEVTVSVGRTTAEARARAEADELFTVAGHPARQGLFGSLEECQAAASRLAHAGVTELVCCLPLVADLPDVLAQLRSIAVGAGILRPGDPASAAPPAPAGWGGRRPARDDRAGLRRFHAGRRPAA